MKIKQLLTKSLLVAVCLLVGANVAWADGIKRTLHAQNYESATSTDWTTPNASVKLITGDDTYGNYSQLNQNGGGGHRTGSKSVTFTADGYASSGMTVAGYIIEFDCNLITGDASGTGGSNDQIFVPTTSASITNNNFYDGDDYIFCLSQKRGKDVAKTETWYVNDPSHTSESTVTLSESKWYHIKLVCSATSVDYTITDNTTHNDIKTGSKTVTSLPSIKGIWGLVGRSNGKINFDNLDIYDYVADFTIPAPTFSSGRVDGANRTYTLTNTYGAETLYYTTSPAAEAPAIGNAAYTSTALVSKEVSFSQVGKYYAYVLHSNGTKASDIAEVEVATVGEVTLATPVFTIEDFVLAEDGHYYPKVSFKSDNSGKEGAPTATLSETSPYTFTGIGSITVTASADGYTSSSNTFTVNSYYQLSKTIDFGALTASDFDAEVWTSGTGVPRDYWTNRAAKIPADVPNRKLTNTSSTAGNPDNSAVVDGITISNYYQRAPEFCIGYGMYTPYDKISGNTNNMNLTVNDATASDYAVYNGWNNYGSGTFNTVLAGNATFGLYRYDTMLRTIKVYSPVSEVATLSLDKTSATVEAGEEVSFTATIASGSPAPTLQWYSCDDVQKTNATAIDGETAAIYSPSTTATGTYYLFVRASNSAGNKDSEVITLNITGTVATPTYTIASYNYEQGGYAITPACETEGATLTYKVGNGDAQSCAVGEPFYAKGGKLVITASKEGWTSASTPTNKQFTLNAAPSSTSPETLIAFQTSDDDIEKNVAHVYKSVTLAGGSNSSVGGRDGNGRLKLRTNQNGNTITLNVNNGYKVTGVSLTANSNNSGSGATIDLTSVTVDGGSNIMTETKTFPISTASAVTYNTGTIAAESSIVFTFDNSNISSENNKKNSQIMASIVVTYMTPAEVEVANAIADCKTYETSDAFATYIDADTYASAAEVYAAHSAWQIAQADAASSNDITKVIRNAAVADATDWDGAVINHGQQYTGAPDEYYIDRNGANIWATQWVYGLPAGKYQVKVATRAFADTYSHIYVSYNGEYDICTARGTHAGSTGNDLGNGWAWTYVPFEITETANILLGFYAATAGGWASCDDWHLYKVTEAQPFEITSTSGWATLYTPYALNFSTLSESLTAYTATFDGSTVELKKVTDVPARTGVVLKGSKGNYNIPLAESSSTPQGDLKGSPTWATSYDSSYKFYYLALNAQNQAQFKLLAEGGSIAAGKAYLQIDNNNSGSAKALSVVFANDPTGIANVNAAEGAQPAKRIVNGQLVIEKNGKRYNAAGAEF